MTQENHCRSCGSPFGTNARFCRGCGAARPETPDGAAPHVEAPTAAQPPSQAGYPAPPPGYPQRPQAGYSATPSAYQAPPPGYSGYVGEPPGYQPPPPGGYPTPAAGYPVQQVQAPPPQQPEKQRPTPSRWLIGGIVAAVVAIVGIGLAIVLATGGSSTQTRLLAAPVVTSSTPTTSTASSSSAPTTTNTHSSPSTPSTPAAAKPAAAIVVPKPRASIPQQLGQQQEVENTIQREFSLITEHKFSAAYALLAPSQQTGESGWVDAHRGEGIYNVSVATSATINSPESATASIVKMRTLDGEGCKNWTGSWNLSKIDGQWRINEANINPEPC